MTPNRGAPYLTASTARTVDEGGSPRFRRIYFLAAPPGPGVGCNQLLGTVACSGLESQLQATILGPIPTIFGFVGTHFEILEIQFFQQLATRLCPLEPHHDSGFGGAIGLKSYFTVVEIQPF